MTWTAVSARHWGLQMYHCFWTGKRSPSSALFWTASEWERREPLCMPCTDSWQRERDNDDRQKHRGSGAVHCQNSSFACRRKPELSHPKQDSQSQNNDWEQILARCLWLRGTVYMLWMSGTSSLLLPLKLFEIVPTTPSCRPPNRKSKGHGDKSNQIQNKRNSKPERSGAKSPFSALYDHSSGSPSSSGCRDKSPHLSKATNRIHNHHLIRSHFSIATTEEVQVTTMPILYSDRSNPRSLSQIMSEITSDR